MKAFALRSGLTDYLRRTHRLLVACDLLRVVALVLSPLLATMVFGAMASATFMVAPVHRRLWAHHALSFESFVYFGFLTTGVATNVAWMTRAFRNFVLITMTRMAALNPDGSRTTDGVRVALPPYPYNRESFSLVIGELQDRDGERVPNIRSPEARPRWLVLPELALYTGVFVTGGIGSGKTAALAYPALKQMIGFRRPVRIRTNAGVREEDWKFSGLVLDEKGDFTNMAAQFCKEWGREDDLIRITPGGKWIWNVIYNPNIPTWAVAYQLGWILKNFNRGAQGSDPFWENAPKELLTEYLSLIDDALGYYNISDYLETLIDDTRQDELYHMAMARFAGDTGRIDEIEKRQRSILKRRDGMGVNLRGSLEACARAGIDMFRYPELRATFCPTRKEYFETDPGTGLQRPRPNVFTGFDQVLDYGKIVGLEMPKTLWFDAAVFIQVALKSQWQDAVLRREGTGPDGALLAPPRFGAQIGHCPTFLMADECQLSATPRDGEFKAVCRSKRASMWELTQSHSSVKSAFGPSKAADAGVYFQNSATHIYLRQTDIDSMKMIQEECGKKIIQKTTLAITEGGNSSELSYVQGAIVHDGLGVSSTKTVATEEKPFLEFEELKTIANNVAVVLPSNGDRTLPATKVYLRPLWVFKKFKNLKVEDSWFDWPLELKGTSDVPDHQPSWRGWDVEDVAEADVVPFAARLGRFQRLPPPSAPPVQPSKPSTDLDTQDFNGSDEGTDPEQTPWAQDPHEEGTSVEDEA